MPGDASTLAQALAALLPAKLTPEQRERYAGIAAIVQATVAGLPHATSEFIEPAPVFDMQLRLAKREAGYRPVRPFTPPR